MSIGRFLAALERTGTDALFAGVICLVGYAIIKTGAPLWVLVVALIITVFVCNLLSMECWDDDNFPGGPPAAA